MKKISHSYTVFLLFIFLVLSGSFLASARVLQPKAEQGVQESKVMDTGDNEDSMSNLMGMEASEGCGNTKECTADRKLAEEAHLDYIYTQKHRRP